MPGLNIIFTDVDGVLNSGYHTKERCCGYWGIELGKVKLLKELADATDSKIVLSSTWRLRREANDKCWKYLVRKFRNAGLEIYDCTPNLVWNRRSDEILEWMRGKDIEHIVILDDEDFYWYRYQLEQFWIDTMEYGGGFHNKYDGITEEHVKYIIENFEKFKYVPNKPKKEGKGEMVTEYTDRVDGFQVREPVYFGTASKEKSFDIVKWEKYDKPTKVFDVKRGEFIETDEYCYSVGTLVWNRNEGSFDFSSVGLRWLEAKPSEKVVEMILDFARMKTREFADAEEG